MTPSRRTFLSTLGGSAIVLAGCTGFQQNAPANETTHRTTSVIETHDVTTPQTTTQQETTPERSVVEIADIEVLNFVQEPHEFHVLVLEQGKPVFWRSFQAEAAEWEDGRVSRPGATRWENPVSGPGTYGVYVRVDDRETWKSWIPTDTGDWRIRLEVNYGTEGLYFMIGYEG